MRPAYHETEPPRWRTVARAVLFILGCAAFVAVGSPLTPALPGGGHELALGAATAVASFGLTAVFVRWDGVRLEDVGAMPRRRSVARFGFGLIAGFVLVALCAGLAVAASGVRLVRAPSINGTGAAVRLAAYVALACREELAFRGYPLRRLERGFGLVVAQALVAAAFAAEHRIGGWPWTQALLGAGIGSLLFGMASVATRGLAVPIGIHAAWNFGEWVLGLKAEPGLLNVVPPGHDSDYQMIRTISYLAVMGCATAGLWLWHRRSRAAVLRAAGTPCLLNATATDENGRTLASPPAVRHGRRPWGEVPPPGTRWRILEGGGSRCQRDHPARSNSMRISDRWPHAGQGAFAGSSADHHPTHRVVGPLHRAPGRGSPHAEHRSGVGGATRRSREFSRELSRWAEGMLSRATLDRYRR